MLAFWDDEISPAFIPLPEPDDDEGRDPAGIFELSQEIDDYRKGRLSPLPSSEPMGAGISSPTPNDFRTAVYKEHYQLPREHQCFELGCEGKHAERNRMLSQLDPRLHRYVDSSVRLATRALRTCRHLANHLESTLAPARRCMRVLPGAVVAVILVALVVSVAVKPPFG